MRIIELRYINGAYIPDDRPYFERITDSEALAAKLKEMNYKPMIDCLGSMDYGYAVNVYQHDIDINPSNISPKPFIIEYNFHTGIWVLAVEDFPTLMRLLHEASMIALASLQTGSWVEHGSV